MELHTLDPLADPRWDQLVDTHPQASIFHLQGWLRALAESYGYDPIVVTSSAPGEPLRDGIVLCRVASWLTGTRLVSLPFSDHCDPLLDPATAMPEFTGWLRFYCDRMRMKYVELRPRSPLSSREAGFSRRAAFGFHTLDLTPPLTKLFAGLHPSSMQRRIRKAEREQLSYEQGCSAGQMQDFYRLLVRTRLRHDVFPQPRLWFRNLANFLGDRMVIRVARHQGVAIAALLTIRHKSTAVYKYGCSDERYHNLGGMPFLFWKFIEESKAVGVEQVDLGRSDLDNQGLLIFKDRLGATRRSLDYFRYQRKTAGRHPEAISSGTLPVIRLVPQAFLPAAGRLMYRHFG
jgi:CelD/BcsL family acetyltransferase involved in cellulose biosynthesis